MDVIEHAKTLKAMPMFASLDESQLKLLAFTSEVFDYGSGEYLFHRDESSDAVYVVMKGRLQIFDDRSGSQVLIAEKHEGEVVGEMGVLRAERRSAAVMVKEDSEVLRIPGDRYLDLVSRNPDLALYVMRDLSDKLASTSLDLARAIAAK
jgi:CRP-like cAMP-binding protein